MVENKNLPVVAIESEDIQLYYDPDTGSVQSYVLDSTAQDKDGNRDGEEVWRALWADEIEANGLAYVIEDTEFGPTIIPTRIFAPRG